MCVWYLKVWPFSAWVPARQQVEGSLALRDYLLLLSHFLFYWSGVAVLKAGIRFLRVMLSFLRLLHLRWVISPGRWHLDVGFDYWGCSVHFGRGHACRLWRPVLNRFGGKMACSLSTQITLKSSGIVHNIEWNCYGLMCYIKYKVKMCLPAIDVI